MSSTDNAPSRGHNAGSRGFRLFADAIEETHARGAMPARKKVIGRTKRRVEDLELGGLKMLEQLRKRLDKQLIDKGRDWVPDEDWVEAMKLCASGTTQLARSLRAGRKAEIEARAGLTDDQLDAVFRTELQRNARQLTEENWRALLTAGMGEDIAEAAIAVWKQRLAETLAKRHATTFADGNPGGAAMAAERNATEVGDGA